MPPARPLYFGSVLVAGPTVTVATAGVLPCAPELFTAVTVTVCGVRASAGVKTSEVAESEAAGVVVEMDKRHGHIACRHGLQRDGERRARPLLGDARDLRAR